jgi:hypothetical protein
VSSSSSPELALELRPPWRLLLILLAWLCAVAVELWLLDGRLHCWRVVAVALVLGGVVGGFGLVPGVDSKALRRISWCADGTWRLTDGCGREWSVALARSSRSWGALTILVFCAGWRRWWAVLTPDTVGADAYRRLSIRWRLQ